VYGKENQRRAAKKGPSFGRFDIFQTRPNPRTASFLNAQQCLAPQRREKKSNSAFLNIGNSFFNTGGAQ
jgi:hypothetical protein